MGGAPVQGHLSRGAATPVPAALGPIGSVDVGLCPPSALVSEGGVSPGPLSAVVVDATARQRSRELALPNTNDRAGIVGIGQDAVAFKGQAPRPYSLYCPRASRHGSTA